MEILFIITIVTFFTIGSHLHDIGLNVQFDNIRNGKEAYKVSNGFIDFNASKTFHVGWYMMYLTFFILIISYSMKIKK